MTFIEFLGDAFQWSMIWFLAYRVWKLERLGVALGDFVKAASKVELARPCRRRP